MKYLLIIFIFNFILPQLEAKLIADDFDNPLFVTNYPNDNKTTHKWDFFSVNKLDITFP